MLHAVIFDLDGTLLNTLADIARAVNGALEDFGFPPHPLEAFRFLLGDGSRNLIRHACPAGTPEPVQEQVLDRYRERIRGHACDETRPYPGAEAALDALVRAGLRVGVITNKNQPTAEMLLGHFFPGIPLALLWGNDGHRPLKPDPASGLALADVLGLDPARIAYVGDSDVDMFFARRCGMLPCGAEWGYRGREELVRSGARLLPESLAELTSLLLARMG